MAHAHAAYLQWLGRLHLEAMMEGPSRGWSSERGGPGEPPRVSVVEAIERSAGMADRFQRMFLRALRALRDLRRYGPAVVVQHASQVNMAERQVNVARADP